MEPTIFIREQYPFILHEVVNEASSDASVYIANIALAIHFVKAKITLIHKSLLTLAFFNLILLSKNIIRKIIQ